MTPALMVAVETDGYGNFRARCLSCEWASKWFEHGPRDEREPQAVAAAEAHTHDDEVVV